MKKGIRRKSRVKNLSSKSIRKKIVNSEEAI